MKSEVSLAEHRERLAAFAREHRALVSVGRGNVDLKLDHSLRVFDEAMGVVDSLAPEDAPGPELLRAIHLAALYHDMGRFPQFVRWGTFNDRLSEDHGRLGVRAIRGAGVLDGESDRVRKVVLAAVVLHNKRAIPRMLPPDIDLVTRVVRDADKLDIYPVMLSYMEPGTSDNPVVTLGLEYESGAYTPVILEQIRARELCDYAQMRYINDFKMLVLSWVYDLNFAFSRRAVLERGYLDRLAASLPQTAAFVALAGQIRADLMDGIAVAD